MNPTVRAMLAVFASACGPKRVNAATIMAAFGVDEVLEEADAANSSAQELACQVLFRCCVHNGKFNNFQIGFLAVANFLESECRPLGKQRLQALQDLRTVLDGGGLEQAIREWLDTNYP